MKKYLGENYFKTSYQMCILRVVVNIRNVFDTFHKRKSSGKSEFCFLFLFFISSVLVPSCCFVGRHALSEFDNVLLSVAEFDLIDPFALFSLNATFRGNYSEIGNRLRIINTIHRRIQRWVRNLTK